MALRLDGIFTQIQDKSWMTLAAVIPVTVVIYVRLGLYRAVVRYMADRAVTVILLGASVSAAVMLFTNQIFGLGVPRSVSGIYWSLLVLSTGGSRLLMRTLHLAAKDINRIPVVIYGAGEAGHLLVRALQESRNYRPSVIIDDDKRLQGTNIAGIQIVDLEIAKKKIAVEGVTTALIAIDEEDVVSQRQAATIMNGLGLEVRIMPTMSDLVSGRIRISNFRKLKIEELLGRHPVEPDPALMSHTTRGRSVMVTGAGGSIGSELCRQIIKQAPKCLVLLEVSEYALYSLVEELTDGLRKQHSNVKLVPILGSVIQKELVEDTINKNTVETIFHAAAYKHVPLVEENAREAIRNNVLGTNIIAQAAGKLKIKNFTLVSTDKAVRPTNIMGATKRLAEEAVKLSAKDHPDTKFCSVRFGNVLGSSGSVIPKFERQILMGGPITLTHPDITRYFMTIPEAAQLVIQASTLAKYGETFILDMGEPIKILELACTMCNLHGRKLHIDETEESPEGAIRLKITGLRPGEKLHEELLLTGKKIKTPHPKIMSEYSVDIGELNLDAVINRLISLDDDSEIADALAKLPLNYSKDEIFHASRNAS